MCSFRGGQIGISRYLNTNSTLPIFVNRESNSDVEYKFYSSKKILIDILTENEAGSAKKY